MYNVILLACLLTLVPYISAVTNAEFYAIIKDSMKDIDNGEDINGVVITMSGGPNDALDLTPLLIRFMSDIVESTVEDKRSMTGNTMRINRQEDLQGDCNCQGNSCQCCGRQDFSGSVFGKHYSATVEGCATIKYLTTNKGFLLTLVINGKTVYNREISLANPPPLCYNIPGLGKLAKICLELYNVNINQRSACLKVTGSISVVVKKWRVEFKLGCFSFRSKMEHSFAEFLQNNVQVEDIDNTVNQ